MLEELLESLDKNVFSAEMIESVMAQFNESVQTKAKEIAEAELSEAVEKALAHAKEEYDVDLQEALEEKAASYIAEVLEEKTVELEEKATVFVESKLAEINERLDLYMDDVVAEFISESKSRLDESLKSEKADMILDAFEAMITAGSIDVMKIAEAKDLSYADSKLSESVEKYDSLMNEFLSLKKENSELLKTGIISEIKQGLSLVESKKFETLANMIPFSKDEKYAQELEIIKEQVKGTVESTPATIVESVVKKPAESSVDYSHLV